jgi:transcriptional regulator with XRE-family HTH domain
MDFGEHIRKLRLSKGYSQRALAEKLGINFTYLSKIETGRMPPPSQEAILRMAEVLEVDEDELLVLADRVPDDVKDVVTQSQNVPAFLRQIKGMSEDELKQLQEYAEEIKAKRESKLGPS